MKNIAVLTSGGDSPGMNACIRSVVRYGISKGLKVYGIRRGYSGLIENEIFEMTERSVGNIIQTGGTVLRTSRCKEFLTAEGRERAVQNLKAKGIEGLVVIGGDGSMHGAQELSKLGVKVACAPGTIDNDLFYTDYTLGFDTAVNTAVSLINNVRDTSASHDRVSIIETMGAGCGDIALRAGIGAGADVIIVPEFKISEDDICKKLADAKRRGKKFSIIVMAEKTYNAQALAGTLSEKLGVDCRAVILGHIQRGGAPSAFDRLLGTKFGATCVDKLLEGECGAVGYRDGKVVYVSIDRALKGSRKFNMEEYLLAQKISF